MTQDICILSGTTRLRLPSPINHRVYADMHAADYRFECGPVASMKKAIRVFKLIALQRVLPRYEWVMWIDDDAFFTNFASDVRTLTESAAPDVALLLADGRVRPGGQWTYINSGVMLLRNNPAALTFLKSCLEADDHLVRRWWNPEKHGMFTNNSDQDAITYLLHETLDPAQFAIVSHHQLNARQYHYASALDEHFICHFPGVPDKTNAVRKFGERFGVGVTLIPPAVRQECGLDDRVGEDFILLPKRRFWERVQRRVRHTIAPFMSRSVRAILLATVIIGRPGAVGLRSSFAPRFRTHHVRSVTASPMRRRFVQYQ